MRLRQGFLLPKLNLRGSVKNNTQEHRTGNPIKQDRILIDLLNQLENLNDYDAFRNWRSEFLERMEETLNGGGTEGIDKAEEAYAIFRVKIDKMVRVVAKTAHFVNDGNLSLTRVSVKAYNILNESMRSSQSIRGQLQGLVPSTAFDEAALGYTRYQIGLVLVSDGFQEYERLNMCQDIQKVLRKHVVDLVADRQILTDLDKCSQAIEDFTFLMLEETGLMQILLKQRQLKPTQPPKALMDEIRGDVLKEALLAKSLGSKSSSSPARSDGSRYSREYNTDTVSRGMDSIRDKYGSTRRKGDLEKHLKPRSSRSSSTGLSETSSQTTSTSGTPSVGEQVTTKLRRIASIEKPHLSSVDSSSFGSGTSEGGKDARKGLRHAYPTESKLLRKASVREKGEFCRENSEMDERRDRVKLMSSTERPHKGFTKDDIHSQVATTGLVKFEPKQARKLRPHAWKKTTSDEDDDKTVVSISSKKKAKMKAKQAKKGKQYIKSIARDKTNVISRKNRSPTHGSKRNDLEEVSEESDDCIQIGENDEGIGSTDNLSEHQPWRAGPSESDRDENKRSSLVSSNRETSERSPDHLRVNEVRESKSKPKSATSRHSRRDLRSPGKERSVGENGTSSDPDTMDSPLTKPTENNGPRFESSSRWNMQDSERQLQSKQRGSLASVSVFSYVPRIGESEREKDEGKQRSGRSRKQQEKSKDDVRDLIKSKDPRLQLAKHGFHHSGIESYKNLASGFGNHVKTDISQNAISPSITSVNCAPSKLKMQWPPPKLEFQGKVHGYQFVPDESKMQLKSPKKPSHNSSMDAKNSHGSKGEQKKADIGGPKKAEGKGKSKVFGNRKPSIRGQVALPSLLDDCSSLDPEDNDIEIFEDMGHSYSSDFERRRLLFENFGNNSTLGSLGNNEAGHEDEDLDPLELIGLKGCSNPIFNQSTSSAGYVAKKRILFEKLHKSGDFLALDDIEDHEIDPVDECEHPSNKKSSIDKSLHGDGHVSRRRTNFENLRGDDEDGNAWLNQSMHSTRSVKGKRSFFEKSEETRNPTNMIYAVTALQAPGSFGSGHPSEMKDNDDSDIGSIGIDGYTIEGVEFTDLRVRASDQTKPWARRAQPWKEADGTDDRKPWKRRDEVDSPVRGLHVDPDTFRRRRELWEMQSSNHCGERVARKGPHVAYEVAHAAVDGLDRRNEMTAEDEDRVILTVEEEAMRMADEVAKLVIEDKARQTTVEQVRRDVEESERMRSQEENIRNGEEARLAEKEEALRMAEDVVRLEAAEGAQRMSVKDSRLRIEKESQLRALGKARLNDVSASPWKGANDKTHMRPTETKQPHRVLYEHGIASSRIFQDEDHVKISHSSADSKRGKRFKPLPTWASPDEDEMSHPIKKRTNKKLRTAVAAKKPGKIKSGRMKPQYADDSSVVKVKKANRQKGEVTYTKKVIPAMGMSARKKVSQQSLSSRWQTTLGS